MSGEGEVDRHVHAWLILGVGPDHQCVICNERRTEPIERAWGA